MKLNDTIIDSPAKKIKEKDNIKINFPAPKKTLIKPNKIPLNILYDDNDIIVINKSPGVEERNYGSNSLSFFKKASL